MAPLSLLQQRVRARKDSSDDEDNPESEASHLSGSAEADSSEAESADEDAAEDDLVSEQNSDIDSHSSSSSPPAADDPSTLSFGALARAQETLGKRKQPAEDQPSNHPIKRLARETERSREIYAKRASLPARPSKHAPQALSSKRAVTRHRSVIDVPKVAPRDPRFDPLTGPLDDNRVKQNYGFLSTYRTSEISQLKSAIRASKNPDEKEKLQKALRRMESRRQADEAKERQQKVIREHRKEEREKVREGKKPFFLKEGEIKKRALVARFEGMGEKKRERVVARRRKKMAGKERKGMPERRRRVEG